MILVISLDGICHTDLDLDKMPNLTRLAKEGVYTKRLRTVFPSVTWNIHTSVTTGKGPDRHGIIGNTAFSRKKNTQFHYYDPNQVDASAIQEPNVFGLAAAKGKTSAAICWPLTQKDMHIRYNIPEFYQKEYFYKYSTQDLVKELLAEGLPFERYGDWSSIHELAALQDDLTCRIVEYIIAQKQPDVLFTHFLIHDSFQHHFGIKNHESQWTMEYLDSLVGRLVAALRSVNLYDTSHMIVFSDHGHEAVSKYFDLASVLKSLDIRGCDIHCVNNGGALFFYIDQNRISKNLMDQLSEGFKLHEAVESVYTKEEANLLGLNSQLNPDSFPDLILTLKHGWCLDNDRKTRSMHGYNPETNPRMDGFMIRAGKSFEAGIVEDTERICEIFHIVENLLS